MSEQGERDLRLVQRAIEGDEASRRELIEQIERAARYSLSQCVRARAIGDEERDLLHHFQVTLLENDHRALKSYEGRASLQTWISVAATRFFLRRVKQTRNDVSLDNDVVLQTPDPSESPETAAERRSTAEAITSALSDLSYDDRLLIQLLYEQDVPAHEAGRVLGLTPSGVRMRKQRLLQRLAKRLRELAP